MRRGGARNVNLEHLNLALRGLSSTAILLPWFGRKDLEVYPGRGGCEAYSSQEGTAKSSTPEKKKIVGYNITTTEPRDTGVGSSWDC